MNREQKLEASTTTRRMDNFDNGTLTQNWNFLYLHTHAHTHIQLDDQRKKTMLLMNTIFNTLQNMFNTFLYKNPPSLCFFFCQIILTASITSL